MSLILSRLGQKLKKVEKHNSFVGIQSGDTYCLDVKIEHTWIVMYMMIATVQGHLVYID